MSEVLSVSNLCKKFDNKFVIKNLSFKITKGERFILLGPNGAGKTTTIKLISGLLNPDNGKIEICGIDLSKEPIKAKSKIGLLYEQPYIYPKLTGMEFINFILDIYHIKPDFEEIKKMLSEFEILDVANNLVESYSVGMKQKLILSSILLRRPSLILLDEPFYGLDPKSQAILLKKLESMQDCSILISTHILSLAEKIASKIGIIFNGELIAVGKKEEIMTKSTSLENIFLQLTHI